MIWIGVSVLGGNLPGRIDDFRFGIGSHGNGQSTSLWPFVWGMQNYWQLDMAKAPQPIPISSLITKCRQDFAALIAADKT